MSCHFIIDIDNLHAGKIRDRLIFRQQQISCSYLVNRHSRNILDEKQPDYRAQNTAISNVGQKKPPLLRGLLSDKLPGYQAVFTSLRLFAGTLDQGFFNRTRCTHDAHESSASLTGHHRQMWPVNRDAETGEQCIGCTVRDDDFVRQVSG